MTRDQIANRIREEHRKHPELDWPDIAAAKILSAMRPTADQIMEVVKPYLRTDNPHWTEKMHEDLRARLTKLLTNP